MNTSPNPFDALRDDAMPMQPDPNFVRRLRRQLEATLDEPRHTDQTESKPERTSTMSSTTTTTPSAGNAPAAAATASALVPYLAVRGATEAIDWYREVFGVIEVMRFTGDDGRIGHAELQLGAVKWYLADEYPDIGHVGPGTLGNTSVALHLTVDDVDAVHTRAVDAGATDERPPSDQSHGSRQSSFRDPFGHRWMLSMQLHEMSTEQLDAANDGFTVTDPSSDSA